MKKETLESAKKLQENIARKEAQLKEIARFKELLQKGHSLTLGTCNASIHLPTSKLNDIIIIITEAQLNDDLKELQKAFDELQ